MPRYSRYSINICLFEWMKCRFRVYKWLLLKAFVFKVLRDGDWFLWLEPHKSWALVSGKHQTQGGSVLSVAKGRGEGGGEVTPVSCWSWSWGWTLSLPSAQPLWPAQVSPPPQSLPRDNQRKIQLRRKINCFLGLLVLPENCPFRNHAWRIAH